MIYRSTESFGRDFLHSLKEELSQTDNPCKGTNNTYSSIQEVGEAKEDFKLREETFLQSGK